MDTVGFIGLGKMGGPVAGHIQAAGFPMVVYDVDERALAPFLRNGAQQAVSPAELAANSNVIISALPTERIVEGVALGPDGVLEGIRQGDVYVDISTGGPDLIRRIAERFRAKGAWAIDAPVSAGQPGADPGIHEVMVAGEPEVVERIRPVLTAYGDQIIHTGPVGTAAICKLVHQLIGCGVSQAIAEGLSLGAKAGVETRIVWDAVRRGLMGRMQMLHQQVPESVFTGEYEPARFTLTLLRKDLSIATALGRQHNVPLPVSNLVEQIIIQAVNRGWGESSGYTVTYQLQEQAAGVSLKVSGVNPVEAASYISTHPELSPTLAEPRGRRGAD
jgi:3-hydroxyisobutyrate dehydrogenase-like beta-hydroxyacid dehydrogenase